MAWVIDGATAVFKNDYLSMDDVQWIVQKLSKELYNSDATRSLKEILFLAIKAVRSKAVSIEPLIASIPSNKLPTFSICLVQYYHNALHYLFLGDCSLFASTFPDIRITDKRILPFHHQVNQVKTKFQDNPAKYNQEVLRKVREIKGYINNNDGYWIGSFSAEVAKKSITGILFIQRGDRFLICSDGFRPNIDEASMVDFKANDIFDEVKLKDIIEKQIASENIYYMHTGIDISDDKTVLLFEV